MTEQDDLFGKEAADSESEPAGAITDEERATDIGGSGIAAGEVRAVAPPARKGRSFLLLGLLLLAVLGGGWYFLQNNMDFGNSGGYEPLQSSPPQRYAIEKKVEVEVVEQQQVASVETENAVVETAVPEAEKNVADTEIEAKQQPAEKKTGAQPANEAVAMKYQVLVGPYLSKSAALEAQQQLAELGYAAEMGRGRGKVTMIRLLEGIYQKSESSERLDVVRKVVKDAFKMPVGDKWAIYVGSFSDNERATRYASQLAEEGVLVTPVPSEVELDGRMLLIAQPDHEAAEQAAKRISESGLSVRQVQK